METVKFIYLGEDLEFVKQMQSNLDEFYKDLGILIETKSLKSMKDARNFIVNKETQQYKLFIIDFSTHFPTYLYVSKMLGFQNNYKSIPMMGLMGVESTDDQFLDGFFSGCKAIFVKGIEWSATVNFAIQLFNPKFLRQINWPSGEFAEDEVECFAGLKLNYFTPDYLHTESNLEFPLKEEIILNTEIANKIGATKFKVIKEHNNNYYYNLKRIYDLEILAISKRIEPNLGLIDPKKREPPTKVEGKALELFLEFKKKLGKWIDVNAKKSAPKKTKLVVIDQNLSIFQQVDKNTDEYSFYLLVHRYFSQDYDCVRRVMPDFLILVLDSPGEKEVKNTINLLPEIIKKVQELPGHSPFIILFNCSLSQGNLQNKYNYPKILTYQGAFDFKLLETMVEKYDAARANKETPERLQKVPGREKRFYISKESKESNAFHPFKIRITKINETTISFKTSYDLDDYMVLKLEYPSKFWMTITPPEKGTTRKVTGHLKEYTAAINGIGEIEKSQLRVYINKVFVPKETEKKTSKDQKTA